MVKQKKRTSITKSGKNYAINCTIQEIPVRELCGGRIMDNPPRSMLIKSLLSDGELVKLVLNGSFPNFCLISY